MSRFICFLCLVALATSLGSNAGCSRQKYRVKADREVYSVIREGNHDSRWKIDDYRLTPDSTSRMFDPFHPDKEPMPQDDPAAHQKMHRVAGMKGSHRWYDNGYTQTIENPRWRQFLLLNDKGEIPLDRDKAIELARLHSPEYQTRLEKLYSSAMRVAQQRFRYDVQFRGLDTFSGNSHEQLANSVSLEAQRRTAAGTQWVAELANTITWTFTGKSSWNMSSWIDVSLTQPLLRGASRKVELESLTQAEREFLYEVRQMVLFQQGHYTRIVTGQVPQNAGASGGVGFYGLLREHVRIQNRRRNIIGLEENLSRFIEMFEANQIKDVTQREELRQNLLRSQSDLLGQINTYQGSIESYVRSLGLPPDLKISVSDPLLEQFQLSSPELTALQENLADLLAMIRQKNEPLADDFREKTRDVVRRAKGELIVLGQDLDILQKSMPERTKNLHDLESILIERIATGERIDPSIYDTKTFVDRVTKLRTKEIPQNIERLQAGFTLLDLFTRTDERTLREMIRSHSPVNPAFDESVLKAMQTLRISVTVESADSGASRQQKPIDTAQETAEEKTEEQLRRETAQRIIEELRLIDDYRDWIRRVFAAFQYELVWLSLMQTRTRLDSMTLVPVSVTADEAFRTASEHRLDWMNERAGLVDVWRQIDVRADALKGMLNLELSGRAGRVDSQRGRTGDLSEVQASLKWDTPLNRYSEMMSYRSSQIDYQQARRDYYQYVDTVHANILDIVRRLQMSRINFEINRNAVLVGTVRVDVMQLRMEQPPARGTTIDPNISTQLLSALDGLLSSQNSLLDTWVEYQTQRMLLDYSMGTMALDDRGRWIDPGTIGVVGEAAPTLAPDAVPLPIPIPVLETPRPSRRYMEE